VGEEPRGDSSHVGLVGVRHFAQTAQVELVGLDGTNEVAESRGLETISILETSANGLEEFRDFLSGQLNGPARVPVVNAVNDVVK